MAKLLFIFLSAFLYFSVVSQVQAKNILSADSAHKIFSVNQKKGLKDDKGRILLPAIYDELGWSDKKSRDGINYLGYKKDNLWGLFDADFNQVVPAKYADLYPLNGELFIAGIKGKYSGTNFYGVIDKEGKVELDFTYRNLLPAGEFIIGASKLENKIYFGMLNLSGKEILPFQYFQLRHLGSNKFELTEESGVKSLIFIDKNPVVIYDDLDSISDFKDGVAVLFKNGKQGLIGENGKMLLPINYKNIEWNGGKKILVTTLNKWQILNDQAKVKGRHLADSIYFLNDSLLIKNTSGFSEIYHTENNEIISSLKGEFAGVFGDYFLLKKNDIVKLISPDTARAEINFLSKYYWNNNYFIGERMSFSGVKYEMINKNGKSIIADTFHFLPQSIAIHKDGFWGLLDNDFNETIPFLYTDIKATDTSHYIVKFRNRTGVINKENEWVISPDYLGIEEIGPGIYKTFNKYLQEFIISGGNKAEAKLHYTIYDPFLVETDVEGNFRLVNKQGEAISTFVQGKYSSHNSKGILFRNNERLSFYDVGGSKKFQIEDYEKVYFGDDEFLPIKKNNSYGFIDYQGLLRIANRYDSVRNFQDELAAIKIRNSWGFINRGERIVVQPYFSEVSDFRNGLSIVKYKGKFGVINTDGSYKIDANYDQIIQVNGFYLLEKNNNWGVADENGKVISYPSYESLKIAGNYIKVEKYGKYRIIDKSGKTLIDDQFDEVIYDSERDLFLCKILGEKKQVFLTDLLKGKNP